MTDTSRAQASYYHRTNISQRGNKGKLIIGHINLVLRFELGTFYALAGNRCFVSFFQNVCCLVITIAGQFEFEEFDGRQKESVPITDAGNLSQDENIVTITSP